MEKTYTTIYEKLLEMQRRVDSVIRDGKNTSDKYDFASGTVHKSPFLIALHFC